MSIFAIGDLQGLMEACERLLDRVNFDRNEDRLWFCGDLVNRGPQSLEVLRFVRGLGERAITVLGNHDLYLLRVMADPGLVTHADPSLRGILDAPDRDELIDWLRHRPLLHHDRELGYTLVHAGLPPAWDLDLAAAQAAHVERELRGSGWRDFTRSVFGNDPDTWHPSLAGLPAHRFTINALTRMRFVTSTGQLDFKHKGAPGTQPPDLYPWFEIPNRRSRDLHILFGHWSTLGRIRSPNVYPLDGGCLWGGTLRAMRLDGVSHLVEIDCPCLDEAGDR
ncbi:diadenosine tetraphosphatase [mine drainage metagenome]|uniref:bis(5'-nucleosyl)-tetraphosphatase (symmetrical) n=2 Tax=mine drainage metagenome TaxID=410659 RepID=T1BH97_9ZZZZ